MGLTKHYQTRQARLAASGQRLAARPPVTSSGMSPKKRWTFTGIFGATIMSWTFLGAMRNGEVDMFRPWKNAPELEISSTKKPQYAIYGNMDPINIPQSCQHTYHTWILWVIVHHSTSFFFVGHEHGGPSVNQLISLENSGYRIHLRGFPTFPCIVIYFLPIEYQHINKYDVSGHLYRKMAISYNIL